MTTTRQQQQQQQQTAAAQRGGGGGLVHKLLFPGYTQSGANDTFQSNDDDNSPTTTTNNNAGNDEEPTVSEADTEIYDNRTRHAALKITRQPQPPQPPPRISPRWQQQPQQQTRPGLPPFFATTQPPRRPPPSSVAVVVPSSPPRVSRKPFTAAERSLSNVALADDDGEDPSQRADASRETGPPSSTDDEDAVETVPSRSTAEEEQPVTTTTTTAAPQSPPVDASEERERAREASREDTDETSEQTEQQSPTNNGYVSEHKESEATTTTVPIWEEEATPAQTAVAKDIIFRHGRLGRKSAEAEEHDNNDDDHNSHQHDGDASGSDVSSTASEMGTVIGVTQLQDLDHEIRAAREGDDDHRYSKPVWDVDDDEEKQEENHAKTTDEALELPILTQDEGANNSNNKHHRRKGSSGSSSNSNNNESSGLSAEASQRLSLAIRRIGSGIKGSLSSRSAPSTPRAKFTQDQQQPAEPESPQTPTSAWLKPSSYNAQHRGTPTSFLLRSPGSSAFVAASNDKNRGRNNMSHSNDSSPSRSYPHALLSPRFLQVPPPIDEDKTSPPGPALPELHQSSSSSNNPLQMARACFSFDAYYHDHAVDDGRYDATPAEFPRLPSRRKRSGKPSSPRRRHHHVVAKGSSSGRRTQVLHESVSWDAKWARDAMRRGHDSLSSVPVNFAAAFCDPRSSTSRDGSSVEPSQRSVERDAPHETTSASHDVEREDALDLLACLVERGVSLETAKDETESFAKLKEALEGDDQHAMLLDQLIRSHEYSLEMSRASQSAASWLKSIGRGTESEQTGGEEAREKTQTADPSSDDGGTKDDDAIDLVTTRALLHTSQKELKVRTNQMEELNQELAKCRAEIGRLKTQQQQQQQVAPFQSPNRSILDAQNDDEDEDEEDDDDEDIIMNRSDGYLDRSFPTRQPQPQRPLFAGSDEIVKYKQALEEANKRIRELHQRTSSDNKEANNPPPVVTVSPFTSPPSPGNTVNTLEADEENFETEWGDLVPSLPPPPDHGLKSPIVQAVLKAWTPDTDLHESLLAWMESVTSGASPHDIPPLAISNLDTQVRDGLVMHVLPLLLRRADIRVDVQTRTLRRTTYDLAVSIEASSTPLMELPLRRRNWENLSARSEAGASVTHSSATSLMGNHAFRGAAASAFRERYPHHEPNDDPEAYGQSGHPTPEHFFPYPLIREEAMAANTGFSYDEMTEDLTADGLSHPPGLMSALGGALGGLMLRRPSPREAASPAAAVVGSHFPESDRYHMDHEIVDDVVTSGYHKDDADRKTPTAANTGSKVPSQTPTVATEGPEAADEEHFHHHHHHHHREPSVEDREEQQPYHRVVSAPPGRIGVTFVEYRGHAMVSKVAPDSPLAGWMYPSDILIAIDELPVSGMRVRDIIQILRERVDNQRALRIISSHAMDAFTSALNSSSGVADG